MYNLLVMNQGEFIKFVSIVIPVFNDSERLYLCLDALQKQSYPQDSYEVIVVNNNSVEDIQAVTNQFSQVKLTQESKPGSYAARNQGLSIAQGEIIAFTDADCIPARDWLEKGVAKLESTDNCGLVAGRIELFFQDPEQPTAVELYQSLNGFPQDKYVNISHFGATANLFTYRQVIEDVGMFNSSLKSSGDMEWGQRVFAAKYEQVYAEDVVIFHPARSSFAELEKKIIRVVGGKYALLEQGKYPWKGFVKILALDMGWVFRSLFDTLGNGKLSNVSQKAQVMPVILFTGYMRIKEKIRWQLKK